MVWVQWWGPNAKALKDCQPSLVYPFGTPQTPTCQLHSPPALRIPFHFMLSSCDACIICPAPSTEEHHGLRVGVRSRKLPSMAVSLGPRFQTNPPPPMSALAHNSNGQISTGNGSATPETCKYLFISLTPLRIRPGRREITAILAARPPIASLRSSCRSTRPYRSRQQRVEV